MAFSNPVTGGQGALIRPAIKSPNYVPGISGWTINRDGTAEFSDLTIHSSDGSSTTVDIANGRITIRNGVGDVVVEIDADGYRLYDSGGDLVAEIGAGTFPGFWTRGFQFPDNVSAFLSGGELVFRPVENGLVEVEGSVSYQPVLSADYVQMAISTGYELSGQDPAQIFLRSEEGAGVARPRVTIGSAGATVVDLRVTGDLAVDDTTWTAYTPAVSNGGTATFTTLDGWYKEIGDMVYFHAFVLVNAAGSGAVAIGITGPVDIDQTWRQIVPAYAESVFLAGMAANGHAMNFAGGGASAVFDRIRVSNNAANNADGPITGAALLAGSSITLQGTYRKA